MNSQASLVSFPFTTCSIRACLFDGDAWFVAKDVFQALAIYWNGPKKSLRSIPDAWKGVVRLTTPSSNEGRGGGEQEISVIKEQAVYKIAFRSDKPEAEEFTNRVAEIVTTIRKTGKYEAPQIAEEYITSAQYHELKHLVYLIGNCFHYKNAAQWATWTTLRKTLHVEAAAKIPVSRYEDAKELLKDIQQAASAFKSAVLEAETIFFKRRFSDLPLEIQELERLCQEEEDVI